MSSQPRSNAAPPQLVVAASLAGIEALLLLLVGVVEISAFSGERATMGVTTSVFFLIYGIGLLIAAWSLSRCQSWARGPILLTQLIQLGVAVSFWGAKTGTITIVLVILAVLVLVALFSPASVRALDYDPTE